MVDRKEYMIKYRRKSRDKINKQFREWYLKNIDNMKNYRKEYRKKNKDRIKEYLNIPKVKEKRKESFKKYRNSEKGKACRKRFLEKHPNYYRECAKKYAGKYDKFKRRIAIKRWKAKNKEKVKAHNRIRHLKIRGTKCLICGSNKNLHFHHTNYKTDEGITVCGLCHKRIHMELIKE